MNSIPNERDLRRSVEWILNSPSLLALPESWDFPNGFQSGIVQSELDRSLDQLTKILHEKHFRLGRIFEELVIAVFNAHTGYEILERGVGIFDNDRQLTELDLLLKCPDGTGLHLEASVKFYLFREDGDRMHLVGTDGRDAMESRLTKLSRQLYWGREYVRDQYPDIPFRHAVFSRGRIFQPSSGPEGTHPLIDEHCERGVWSLGFPDDKSNVMVNRWQWISWPPLELSEVINYPGTIVHRCAGGENPVHRIYLSESSESKS